MKRYYDEIRSLNLFKVLKILGITPKRRNRKLARIKCVFHKERNASLTFVFNKSSFLCFGCGKSGDIFHLVMQVRGYTRIQTMVFFKRHFGINPKDYQSLKLNQKSVVKLIEDHNAIPF